MCDCTYARVRDVCNTFVVYVLEKIKTNISKIFSLFWSLLLYQRSFHLYWVILVFEIEWSMKDIPSHSSVNKKYKFLMKSLWWIVFEWVLCWTNPYMFTFKKSNWNNICSFDLPLKDWMWINKHQMYLCIFS